MSEALRPTLQSMLLRAWTRRGVVASALWPISLVYQSLVWTRRQLYRTGFLVTQRVDAIVMVVGNVVAGGAGKTPTVIALVQHLQSKNRVVGVISRGYGRKNDACTEVLPDSRPDAVGDEPLLIRRATGAPVFVGRNRHQAAAALLKRYPEVQFIVCDDGLQHYGLYRDLEICVFDDRGCGNGWTLPAGLLRESWPRRPLASAGQCNDRLLVLHTGGKPAFAGFTANRSLAAFAMDRTGARIPLATLASPGEKPLLAVAGIAQPESFFTMLRALDLPLQQTLALPDHYHFDSLPSNIYGGYRVICTEKDAAKLWPLAPSALAVALLFKPEPAFFAALDVALAGLAAAKLSSGHGHQTS